MTKPAVLLLPILFLAFLFDKIHGKVILCGKDDGEVSKDEFDAAYEERRNQRKKYRQQVFDRFDIGDGQLSQNEVRAYLAEVYRLRPKNAAEFEGIFREFDAYPDGSWNVDEFDEFVKNIPFDQLERIPLESSAHLKTPRRLTEGHIIQVPT